MPPTQHESGLVAGDVVHAMKKGINGAVAWCGAGRITKPLAGRFDPDDVQACPACCERVASTS